MYELKVDISGFQSIEASFESASLVRFRQDDSIRVRDKIDGDIIFKGDAYDTLKAQKDAGNIQLDARVYSGDLIYSGKLILRGEWSLKSKECRLAMELEDIYTKILKNIDVKYRIPYEFRFTEQAEMIFEAEFEQMFQMRAVTTSGGTDSWIENEMWKGCQSDVGKGSIEEFDVNRVYNAAQVIIPDTGSGGWDGHQCTLENVPTTFCWQINQTNFLKSYYCAKRYVRGQRPPLIANLSDSNWQFMGDVGPVGYDTANLMGSIFSPIRFDESVYDEANSVWRAGSCTAGGGTTFYQGYGLYKMLEFLLDKIDTSVSINFNNFFTYADSVDPDYKNLILYNATEDESGQYKRPNENYSLQEVIDIYRSLFNIDWKLESNAFVFKHPSQVPALPPSYQSMPYQFIDRIFGKDFSSERFSSDQGEKIRKEKFTIGTSESLDFGTQVIEYDNNFDNIVDTIDSSIEIDLAHSTSDPDSFLPVVIQYGSDGFVPVGIPVTNEPWSYNYKMELNRLIKKFYNYDRPFASGILYPEKDREAEQQIQLTLAFLEKCEIEIPYNRQDLVNMDYLLVSSFGNLKAEQVQVAMASGTAVINASKQ